MIQISHEEVFGFNGALRGMRNPLNSWNKADSVNGEIGPKDLDLAKRLIASGSDHRKFLRMIHVQVDVLAPLYWWKEFDTYKVGTAVNSCSTMHKITAKKFVVDDFSHDHMDYWTMHSLDTVVWRLNCLREHYLETKDKIYWYSIIQLLPSSYNQLRTLDLNYEVLLRIYFGRKDHKLDEWRKFCDWILKLPHMKEFLSETEIL